MGEGHRDNRKPKAPVGGDEDLGPKAIPSLALLSYCRTVGIPGQVCFHLGPFKSLAAAGHGQCAWGGAHLVQLTLSNGERLGRACHGSCN